MYETIVVGTDGSDGAGRAVAKAAWLARQSGAQVHVVTVAERRAVADLEEIRSQLPREFTYSFDPIAVIGDQAEDAAGKVEAHGVEVTTHVPEGDPASEILAVAKSVDADLVIVGSRGRSTVKSLMLGSVSTKLAHHADRDILIVHDVVD